MVSVLCAQTIECPDKAAAIQVRKEATMSDFSTTLAWFNPCFDFDQIDPAGVITDPPTVVFEEANSIKVMEGAASTKGSGESRLRVEQSVELPSYANQATVFLNGWQARFDDSDDHHVFDVAVILSRIRVVPGKSIQFTATGDLADKHRDAPFTLTYRFGIIAWNDAAVRAIVDHNDADHFCRTGEPHGGDNFFKGENTGAPDGATTALSSFPSFLRNPGFATGRQVAVLPRGFVFAGPGEGGGDDRHLLQLAYNLESVAPFVRNQDYHKADMMLNPLAGAAADVVHDEFVSWKTTVIRKDNDLRFDYSFAEFVSAIGGPDVEILQPEFAVLPREDKKGHATGGVAGLKSADVIIAKLPYAAAIPILTGWDMGYTPPGNRAHHIKEFGVFIDQIQYERQPDSTGTLRYTVSSIVRDKDNLPDNYFRHKVTILGLRPIVVQAPG
jgi:hypothetical protein